MSLSRHAYKATNIVLGKMPHFMRTIIVDLISVLPFSMKYPPVLMIEPTNICNGTCPLCPIGAKIDRRAKGWMKYEDYVRIVDEVKDFAKIIIMNFAGETLLNPEIENIINYSEALGIRTIIGTNGAFNRSDELINSGVSEVLWAMDGATKETYHRYRNYEGTADFDDVVRNLQTLCDTKSERGLSKPKVILQFVVMKDNEHEMDDIIRLGKRIGVDAIDFKPVCLNEFFLMSFEEIIEKYLPKDESYANCRICDDAPVLQKPLICSFAFHETEILHNGDVTICCFDYDGNYVVGNIFKDGGFKKIWRGREFKSMRRKMLKQELEICARCGYSLKQSKRIYMKDCV